MSHVSKIELVIHSLDDLKDACQKLGFQFMENQKSYKWYGRWVGDSPLPEDPNRPGQGKGGPMAPYRFSAVPAHEKRERIPGRKDRTPGAPSF